MMNHRIISLESQVNHFTDRFLCIVTRWGCLDRKWQAYNHWRCFQVHKSTPSLLYHTFRVLPRKTESVVDFLCSSGQFLRFTVLKKYTKVPSSLRALPLGNSYFLNFPPEARMRPHQAADGHSRPILGNPDQMDPEKHHRKHNHNWPGLLRQILTPPLFGGRAAQPLDLDWTKPHGL
jgi:hypothetical protein